MHKKRNPAAYSYLMEIIIALCVFSVCGLFCITLFVKADHMQKQATATNHAVTIAQSQISILKNDPSLSNAGMAIYDTSLNQSEEGPYKAIWKLEQKDTVYEGMMEIWQDTTLLTSIPFCLDVKENEQ